jgi:serine/threonine protein kinase
MLDLNYNIKLADFGLSGTSAQTGTGRLGDPIKLGSKFSDRAGTPAYMAPEVLARQTYNGADADIWSAAVVLFIMLMGSPPWRQCDHSDFFYKKIANTGNAASFWEYYTTNFAAYHDWTQGSMEMLSMVFLPDHSQRAGIALLRSTAFMQAPALTLAQVKQMLPGVAKIEKQRSEIEDGGGPAR